MHITIDPEVNKHYNCMDNYCMIISSLIKRDYQMIFLEQWDFDFKPNKTIGESIYFYDRNYPIVDEKNYKLMSYHGVDIKYNYVSSPDVVMAYVDQSIKSKNPILVRFDGAFLDWGTEVEKEHRRYYQMFLVVGIDEYNIYYFDMHYPDKERIMSIDLFKKGCILHFKNKPYKTICAEFHVNSDVSGSYDLPYILNLSLGRISRSLFYEDSFVALRNFASHIKDNFIIEQEINPQKPIAFSPIMERFTLMTGSRNRYGFFIKYLADRFAINEFNKISDSFFQISSKWYELWMQIIRSMYRGEIDSASLEKIRDKLIVISEQEEEAYLNLRKYSK